MSTSLRIGKCLSEKITFDTETDNSKSDSGSESNFSVPTTNNVVSQDINSETLSSDSETEQFEQDLTESLSEHKDLQEPQTDRNAQLRTPRYHKAPNIELKGNMIVTFKTLTEIMPIGIMAQ